MRDPLEGLTDSGMIRTGAHIGRIDGAFRPVHDAVVAALDDRADTVSVYAYGSVVTGQAVVGTSDVDLLTISSDTTGAEQISTDLSARFAAVCRSVEIATAAAQDFVGDSDASYGNRVFLRHYCVLLSGSDVHRPGTDFAGDRRAARGFNGDIARHAGRWRISLAHRDPVGTIATRMARKSLLAVAGLVSVHDGVWTTDRTTAAQRWGEIAPEHRDALAEMMTWASGSPEQSPAVVEAMLDRAVRSIVDTFDDLIGLWPD